MIFDVGANRGDFALSIAARNGDVPVVAVEPVPELCQTIRERAAACHLTNLEVAATALGDREGSGSLHLAAHDDWGISSLHALSEDLAHDPYWSSRSDLHFDREIPVPVITLERLIERVGPRPIQFIKIDSQGGDLAVLRSAGTHGGLIQAGMLEVAATRYTKLYDVPGETLEDAFVLLKQLGFEVYSVKPNDPACNEVNLYFCRMGLNWRDLEISLQLSGTDLYDGRHYWHQPSGSPLG